MTAKEIAQEAWLNKDMEGDINWIGSLEHRIKMHALSIACEAVEEEKSKYQIGKYTTGSHLDSLAQSERMALDSLLTRIKKLTEES